MSAARRFLLLFMGLASASCAVGTNTDGYVSDVDSGEVMDGDAASEGSAGDVVAEDVGSPMDAGTGDSAAGNDVVAPADASSSDSAPASDADASDAPASDAHPSDAGTPSDTGSVCVGHGTTGALVVFDLASQSGSETSVAATSSVPGISAGALSRSAALTTASGSGSINSSNWATGGSADPTRYYTFSVTPAAGCSVALTSLALDVKASSTGPASGDVATSADGFATHSASFAGTSTPAVSVSVVGATTAVEIRVYGYGATASAGTLRIQNTMTLSGTIN